MGAGLAGTGIGVSVWPRLVLADEDTRNAHEQFHRYSVDAISITFVTRTGNYDFLVAYVGNPGNADSALIARRALMPDQGVLYVNDTIRPIAISNQGVHFPTDLFFIAKDGRVLEVHPNIMANDSRAIGSEMPVKAALQVIGGTAMRVSAMPGDHLLSRIFGRTL
ncbi:MAG TPA: DUF192 domain-containing protein [Stellaceae bacterium]|nr:DUF192 domain-containing protein [Stellaceae bacterium]